MHRELERYLRSAGIDPAAGPPSADAWAALLAGDDGSLGGAGDAATSPIIDPRTLRDQTWAVGDERYREVVENANDLILTITLDRTLTSINRAGERLLGYTREELVGQNWRTLLAPEYQALLDARAADREAGRPREPQFTVDLIARDGRRIPIEFSRHFMTRDGVDREVLMVGRDLTDRLERERASALAEQRYTDLVEHATDIIATTSFDGRITSINQAGADTLGYSREQLIGRRWSEFDTGGAHATYRERSQQAARTGAPTRFEVEAVARDGRAVSLEAVTWLMPRDDGPGELVLIARDITERRAHERAQALAEQRYTELVEHANDLIATTALDGRITSVNRAYTELTGFDRDEFVGRMWRDFIPEEQVPAFAEYARRIAANGSGAERIELDLLARDGRRIPLEISTRVMMRDGVPHEFVTICRDITERREYEHHLLYLTQHDALTGLPNREQLSAALAERIATAPDQPAVLALLDLDQFKLVNDTLGHAAGDAVLVATAQLLQRITPGAFAARLSGDEFALLLPGHEIGTALAITERLRRGIEGLPIEVAGERVFVTASIGLVSLDGAATPGTLLAEADAAMYAAKDAGRNRVFWSEGSQGITGPLAELLRWSAGVRSAITERRLEVHYQPIVDLITGETAHYEALVRLRDRDGRLALPGQFFPAAERFGLVPQIDKYVLDVVLEQLLADGELHIFVNLSPHTLADERLLESLITRLAREPGLAPRLGFEITESAAVRNLDVARRWIETLGELGCAFALDDFGTGYNALSQARELPVRQLKIDSSFVRALAIDSRERAIVSAVRVLATGLGMTTVAEGIESAATLSAARELGITHGQGYYLGMPAPASEAFEPRRRAA